MVSYLTTMFSVVVFVPVIVICYLAISKKLRFKPILYGMLIYAVVSAMTQLLLGLANAVAGGYIAENAVLYVLLWSVVNAVAVVLLTGYVHRKIIDGISLRDSLGFGLGLGGLWLMATVGVTLFFSTVVGMTITDGGIEKDMATATAEAIAEYNSMKENFLSKGIMDYTLLVISGISLMMVTMANSVLVFEYIRNSERKYIIIAFCTEMTVLLPFVMAYEAGFVNIYVQIFMCILAAAAIWYMVSEGKKYPLEDKKPFVRQSPLEGRDFTRRIKKRK